MPIGHAEFQPGALVADIGVLLRREDDMQAGQARVVVRGHQLRAAQCVAQQRLEAAAHRRQLLAVVGVRDIRARATRTCRRLARATSTIGVMRSRSPNAMRTGPDRDFARKDRADAAPARQTCARDSRASPTAASRAPARTRGLRAIAAASATAQEVARAFRLEAGAAQRDDRVSARRHRQCGGNATGRQRVPPGAWRQAFSGSVARRFMSRAGTGFCLPAPWRWPPEPCISAAFACAAAGRCATGWSGLLA